jgi:hypothetical protein
MSLFLIEIALVGQPNAAQAAKLAILAGKCKLNSVEAHFERVCYIA